LSLTVGSKIGHLADSGRLNVGLSRCSHGLIITGNVQSIAKSQQIKRTKLEALLIHVDIHNYLLAWQDHVHESVTTFEAIMPSTADADDEHALNTAEVGPCKRCGQVGHISKDCENQEVRKCNECDSTQHLVKECPVAAQRKLAESECRRCGEKGHVKNNCPNARVHRCSNCKLRGHRAAECPTTTVRTITQTAEARDPILAGVYAKFGFRPVNLGAVRVLGARMISTPLAPGDDADISRQNPENADDGTKETVGGVAGWDTGIQEPEASSTSQW